MKLKIKKERERAKKEEWLEMVKEGIKSVDTIVVILKQKVVAVSLFRCVCPPFASIMSTLFSHASSSFLPTSPLPSSSFSLFLFLPLFLSFSSPTARCRCFIFKAK